VLRTSIQPKEDGLNETPWYGKVYLFPPSKSYFWDKKNARWKATRGLSPTLTSGHALWWRTLKKKWLANEIEQAIFFTNFPDMIMYGQDMFRSSCLYSESKADFD